MRYKNNVKLFIVSVCMLAIPSLSFSSNADPLLDLLEELESKRFLMGFDAIVREQLEAHSQDIASYAPSIQSHYYLLYQDALARSGKLQDSLQAREKLLAISQRTTVQASYLRYSGMLLGLTYANLSRGEESKSVLADVIDESLEAAAYKIAFHSSLILGDVLSSEKNFSQAFANYQKAQSILSEELLPRGGELQSFAWQAEMNYRIAYVYRHMWRDKDSIEYFEKALYFDRKIENMRNIKYDLNQIGDAYLRLGDLSSAQEHYSMIEALLQSASSPDEGRWLDLASSMIKLHIRKGDLKQAEKYLNIANEVEGEIQSVSIRIRYYLALAHYANSIGEYEDAIKRCNGIEQIATERTWAEYGNEVIKLSAQAHYNLGRYKESSRLFGRMHSLYLERSDHVRLMTAEVERARFDFESEALKVERLLQDNQITELALESENSKLNMLILIIALATMAILSLAAMMIFALRNEKKLKMLADYDGLTGVLNRRAIIEYGESRFQSHKSLSLLLVDVDHFKKVNDSFGHAKGDSVLQYITLIASGFCQENVSFGRLGGEEFLFVIDGMSSIEALVLARKFTEVLRSKSVEGMEAPTVSIGHAYHALPLSPEGFNTLLEQADEALYRAKSSGRDCIRQYESAQEVTCC